MGIVNPLPSQTEDPARRPASQFEQLLSLLHTVGNQLVDMDGAYYRAWGRHLLDDWRSLELMADRVRSSPPQDVVIRADSHD